MKPGARAPRASSFHGGWTFFPEELGAANARLSGGMKTEMNSRRHRRVFELLGLGAAVCFSAACAAGRADETSSGPDLPGAGDSGGSSGSSGGNGSQNDGGSGLAEGSGGPYACQADTMASPQLVVFDTAGDYTIANGKAFTVPNNAYAVDMYAIGGGGSSDTLHDTPSTLDNRSVMVGTPGATVKHTVDRGATTLLPGQRIEFSIGAGGKDPQNVGMCSIQASNHGERGKASVLYDPAFPGKFDHIKLKAAGGGRGSYCGNGADPPGSDSCLAGDGMDECFTDVVADSESTYDSTAGDKYWKAEQHTAVDCQGVSTTGAVQPTGDVPGCGPGAAMVAGWNYQGLVSARAGGVAFRITPCAKATAN